MSFFSCSLLASRSYLSSALCGRPSALPDPYKNPKHSIFPSASNQFQMPPFPYPHLTLPLPPLGPIDRKTTRTHEIEKWSEKDGEQEASGSACFSIEWIPQTFHPRSFLFQESCVCVCACHLLMIKNHFPLTIPFLFCVFVLAHSCVFLSPPVSRRLRGAVTLSWISRDEEHAWDGDLSTRGRCCLRLKCASFISHSAVIADEI